MGYDILKSKKKSDTKIKALIETKEKQTRATKQVQNKHPGISPTGIWPKQTFVRQLTSLANSLGRPCVNSTSWYMSSIYYANCVSMAYAREPNTLKMGIIGRYGFRKCVWQEHGMATLYVLLPCNVQNVGLWTFMSVHCATYVGAWTADGRREGAAPGDVAVW